MTTGSSVLRRLTLGSFLALLLFAGLEGAARWLRPAGRAAKIAAEAADWIDYSSRLGWRTRPGFRGVAFGAPRSFDDEGFFSVDSDPRADGKRRLLFLGDSRTFGNGVPTADNFVEVLAGLLPGSRVFNLGIPGYSSYQGYAALELYAPRLHPDVVAFAYGYNDRRYVLRPEAADGKSAFRRLAWRALWTRLADSLALVDLLRGQPRESLSSVPNDVVPRPVDLRALVPRVPPAAYRDNLTAVVRYCRARRLRLVFLLFDDNPVETADLERGLGDLRAHRYGVAETELQSAVALGNSFSDAARLYLAQLYDAIGRPRDAATAALSPRTFDSLAGGYPTAANSEYRAIVLRVAAENGLSVVDAGAAIDRHPEWYFDNCHFKREGHRLTAELLAAELGQAPAADR